MLPRKPVGFTLIELLVVMVIISILAGVAMVTIGSNSRKQVETLANQLKNLILLAETEAMLRPATLGLRFTSQSFQFYQYQPTAWQPIKQGLLAAKNLPPDIQITIKPQNTPTIIITPDGNVTPFVILIGKKNKNPYYQVIGKENGEITSEAITPQ